MRGDGRHPQAGVARGTNPYLPFPARIQKVVEENALVKSFVLELEDPLAAQAFTYQPGQFVMVSVPHCGEAPISFASPPHQANGFTLTVRKAGRLTGAMHGLRPGDTVGIRGPYGRSFPMHELQGRDLLFVAGGIGLAPLRSVILSVLARRADYGRIIVLYGCRTPGDICFRADLAAWREIEGVEVGCTVDKEDAGWQGKVGLVTSLLDTVVFAPERTTALVCGPEIMIKVVLERLEGMGVAPADLLTTLERHMKCGIGLCGHCHCSDKLVCADGPVFSLAELGGIASGCL